MTSAKPVAPAGAGEIMAFFGPGGGPGTARNDFDPTKPVAPAGAGEIMAFFGPVSGPGSARIDFDPYRDYIAKTT